jgi:uncharacterized SAM-binding protein YcdF (DUF218 family)
MFIVASKVLDLLLAPLSWALLLVAAGVVLRRRRPDLAWGLVAVAGLVLLLFSSGPVADAVMRWTESSAPRTYRPGEPYDAVIVLGGILDEHGSPVRGAAELSAAADRITRAFEILRSGQARYALLSGGLIHATPGDPSEAEQLSGLLQGWGIPADRILVEPRSRNTRENAVESAELVAIHGWRRLLLVTSAAHMPRAVGCFRRVGLVPDTLPVDYRAGAGRSEPWWPRVAALSRSTDAIRELAGRVAYWVAGYTQD